MFSSAFDRPSTSSSANVLSRRRSEPEHICVFRRRAASVARSTPKRSMSGMSSLNTRKPRCGKAMSSSPPCIMPAGPISPAVEQPETGSPGKASVSASASRSASWSMPKNAMTCWKAPAPSPAFASRTASCVDDIALAATRIPHLLGAASGRLNVVSSAAPSWRARPGHERATAGQGRQILGNCRRSPRQERVVRQQRPAEAHTGR